MASSPPESLVESFRWAHHAVQCCVDSKSAEWFLSPQAADLPVSTWFSGYGCAEIAIDMINAAKKTCCGTDRDTFVHSYQFEIASKARASSAKRLNDDVCQFIGILRVLSDDDRKALLKLEAESSTTPDDVYEFLLGKVLQDGGMCCRHKMRWGVNLFGD